MSSLRKIMKDRRYGPSRVIVVTGDPERILHFEKICTERQILDIGDWLGGSHNWMIDRFEKDLDRDSGHVVAAFEICELVPIKTDRS